MNEDDFRVLLTEIINTLAITGLAKVLNKSSGDVYAEILTMALKTVERQSLEKNQQDVNNIKNDFRKMMSEMPYDIESLLDNN